MWTLEEQQKLAAQVGESVNKATNWDLMEQKINLSKKKDSLSFQS